MINSIRFYWKHSHVILLLVYTMITLDDTSNNWSLLSAIQLFVDISSASKTSLYNKTLPHFDGSVVWNIMNRQNVSLKIGLMLFFKWFYLQNIIYLSLNEINQLWFSWGCFLLWKNVYNISLHRKAKRNIRGQVLSEAKLAYLYKNLKGNKNEFM